MPETKEKNIKSVVKNVGLRKQITVEFDLDKDYSKYYWLIIPILTIIYFLYSYSSSGFYQDDEVTHYLQMRDFWTDHWIFMSNFGKPGWKIFLVLPALLGYKSVLFTNSFITALTSFFIVKLASILKMKNSILAGLFFAFQPLVLQISFRSYAEIFTGLSLVLSLYFYFKDKYILSALFCGLAFTARQETALLALILAGYFIYQKKYLPIIFLGVIPFIYNFIGYLHTGDYLWIWTEMKNLGEFNLGIKRSFFHYFEVFIFISGPIVFTCFLLGIFIPFLSSIDIEKLNKKKFWIYMIFFRIITILVLWIIGIIKYIKYNKEFLKREFLVYIFFFVQFLFQCYLVAKGTNPGSWRYILQAAPFASIIALIGFNQIFYIRNNKFILPILVWIIAIVLLFLSREATGLLITDNSEFLKLFVIILFAGGALLLLFWSKEKQYISFITFTCILLLGFTFITERPKELSPENATVSQVAAYYNDNLKDAPEVLYNNSSILFFANVFGEDKSKFKILNMKSLEDAPKGTLIIWDSHYSYRLEYKNDCKLESLTNNTNYKKINQFISNDHKFGAYLFEKQ